MAKKPAPKKTISSKSTITKPPQKIFEEINLGILRKFSKFRKLTLKLISELKNQLIGCKIYQIGERSFNIQDLLKNHYSEIIIRNALNANSSNIKPNTVISDVELSKIIENFNYLNLKTPKIIESGD